MFLQGPKWTPLLLASYANQTDVVELLIQHGAQLDVRNKASFCETTVVLPILCMCKYLVTSKLSQIVYLLYCLIVLCRKG